MIQFNLLPDVKLEYVKAQRTKRLVIGGAFAATAVTFVIFALLFLTVYVVQKKNIKDLDKDVATYSKQLKDTTDLNKILTIQSQLGAINGLHDQKPVASRTFSIIQRVTPVDVTVGDLSVDFDAHTMSITGAASSLDKVNIFTDTLKFVTYKEVGADKGVDASHAFSSVVLSQFSRSTEGASFVINLSYDPALFSNQNEVDLNIPPSVTTRSVVEQPSDIFKKSETSAQTTGN